MKKTINIRRNLIHDESILIFEMDKIGTISATWKRYEDSDNFDYFWFHQEDIPKIIEMLNQLMAVTLDES